MFCIYLGTVLNPIFLAIFGESAGAASISLHMVSDLSKGLFHKAIIMSGTIYMPWVVLPITDWPQRTARKLGWNGDGGEKGCLYFLQRSHSDSVTRAQYTTLTEEDIKSYLFFPTGPCVEPYQSEQCFLSKDPRELIHTAWSKDIPLILGGCSEEGLLFYKSNKLT